MQSNARPETRSPGANRSLLAGGVAAILASACCLGPLVLLALGFSGAWIANLTLLEPFRPLFIAVSLISLWLASRRIWRSAVDCRPGEVCAVRGVQRGYELLFMAIAGLVVIALVFPHVANWFY